MKVYYAKHTDIKNNIRLIFNDNKLTMYFNDNIQKDIIQVPLSSYNSYIIYTLDNTSFLIISRFYNKYISGLRDIQIDTGNLVEDNGNIIISSFNPSSKLNIESPFDITYEEFEKYVIPTNIRETRRYELWDSYSLQYENIEFKSDADGIFFYDVNNKITTSENKDYIEFSIQKYKGSSFDKGTLTRDIDNNTIYINSSNGVVNTKQLELKNGSGKIRWYPLGYVGKVDICIGYAEGFWWNINHLYHSMD